MSDLIIRETVERNVVLLDDDFIIRQVIKIVMADVTHILREEDFAIKLYTSGNGVEGLGYIALSKPHILIVDATLPKYSGRELIEFIASNPKYQTPDISVIVLSDRKIPMKLPPNHQVLNKEDSGFIQQLTKMCIESLLQSQEFEPAAPVKIGAYSKLKLAVLDLTVRMANRADLRMANISRLNVFGRALSYIWWFCQQMLISLLIGFSNLVNDKVADENLAQKRADLARFRVREYPTLATALLTIFFIVLQTVLLAIGGVVVFSVRVESVFADYNPEYNLDLSSSTFNTQEVEYKSGRISLKEIATIPTNSGGTSGTGQDVPSKEVFVPNQPSGQGSLLDEGLSTKAELHTDIYPFDNPEVIITQPVEYSKLLSIIETSSVNDATSSVKGVTEVGLSIPSVAVTYQLSSNGTDWYYYNLGRNEWEQTKVGLGQSNLIQQVNHFLPEFDTQVGKSKQLYIKLFLHSDGATQVSVSNIKVNRVLNVVTPIEEDPAAATTTSN